MNINSIITGVIVSPEKILNRKKERIKELQDLLASGGQCVICFTMNIPGNIKLFPLARAGFSEGKNELLSLFPSASIKKTVTAELSTGCEFMILLDMDPTEVKKKTILLEESHPIGRLFDIDIPGITRAQLGIKPRKCLVCENDAAICEKNHVHSLDFIIGETVLLLYSYFKNKAADTCAACATRALLYEVSTTPKPGLVDRSNSGSHKDMDFFTFLDSSAALTPWFRDFFCIGWDYADSSDKELFAQLRFSGQKAEDAMFQATSGINTHKGLIFSMAILCGSLGKELSKQKDYIGKFPLNAKKLLKRCASLGQCSLNDFISVKASMKNNKMPNYNPHTINENAHSSDAYNLQSFNSENHGSQDCHTESNNIQTAGERCFAAYQINGARGEAALGFPIALNCGLPALKRCLSSGLSLNDAACVALLSIISSATDTNMINRSTLEEAEAQKIAAEKLLSTITQDNFQEKLIELDQIYIKKNLSPGGCADILAITLMLYFLEEKSSIDFKTTES